MMLSESRRLVLSATTEAQWQNAVIERAHSEGWLVHAMKDSRQQWWGTDSGFPDLVMVRGGRVLFIELKDMKGRIRADQQAWAYRLKQTDVEYYCLRPSDEEEMWRILE